MVVLPGLFMWSKRDVVLLQEQEENHSHLAGLLLCFLSVANQGCGPNHSLPPHFFLWIIRPE